MELLGTTIRKWIDKGVVTQLNIITYLLWSARNYYEVLFRRKNGIKE